jgi:signal transduction histidine kinase
MRRRLVVAIAGVAAAAVLLLAVPLGIVLSNHYRDEELLRLQRDTVAATREIDVPTSPADRVELPPSADQLTVYDRAGRRVAGAGSRAAPATVRAALRDGKVIETSANGMLSVAVPLLAHERVSGAVLAQRPDHVVGSDARDAWLVLGVVALGIILAAALAAALLGRRLAQPLERLAAAAGRLGDGDFSVRSERSGVPELDAVGAALDSTAARLDGLIRRERAFSADASHQLRTPLQALRIELEALELRGDGRPEITAAIAQVDRLTATIDTLLALARDAEPGQATADLAELLDEAESRWRGPLADSGRPLRVRVQSPAVQVRASPPVVSEILDVLLDNAGRHGAGAVTMTVRRRDRWLVVEVTDEGEGFADPATAFDRRAGDGGVHGIGLALARSLADAEGGYLSITDPGPDPTVALVLQAAVRSQGVTTP